MHAYLPVSTMYVPSSSYNKFGDPEVGDSNVLYSGFDGGRYPFPMSVTFGLSVQF